MEDLELRIDDLVGLGSAYPAVIEFVGSGSGGYSQAIHDSKGGITGYVDYFWDAIDPGEIHSVTASKGLVVSANWNKQDFTYIGSGAVTFYGLGTVVLKNNHSRYTSDSWRGSGPYLGSAFDEYYFGVVKGVYNEEDGTLENYTILDGTNGGFDWTGFLMVGSGGVVQNIGSAAPLKTGNNLTSDTWTPEYTRDECKVLTVVAGGSADNVTVKGAVSNYEHFESQYTESRAGLLVSSGGTATNVTVLEGGIAMAKGGTIDKVFVGNGGVLYLSGWAGAHQVAVDSYGSQLAGPQYLDTTVLNAVRLDSGGQLTNTLDWGFRGGHAPSVIANAGGGILNGVTANGVAYVSGLDYAGNITLTNGQQGLDLTVRGFRTITSHDAEGNPTAYNTIVASLNVSSGGIVNGATVGDEGTIYVSEGANVSGLTASGGRIIFAQSSGWSDYFAGSATVNGISVMDGGELEVNSKFGLTASNVQIGPNAGLTFTLGDTASEDYTPTQLNGTWSADWGNGLFYTDDGTMSGFGGQFGQEYRDLFYSSAYVSARLSMTIINGGILTGADLRGYGSVNVRSGGKIFNTKIKGVGVSITSGGYASSLSATIEPDRNAAQTQIWAYGSGATLEDTVLNGGMLGLEIGAVASGVTMTAPEGYTGHPGDSENYGPVELEINPGGTANNVVASAGVITLGGGSKEPGTDDAKLSDADVHSAAMLVVKGDGAVLDGTINLGGTINTTATRYEWVEVEIEDPNNPGQMIPDWQRIEKNNTVANATTLQVNFDLTERNGTEELAMIDNLANLEGVTLGTITVSATQASGTYILAGGADAFTGNLTVVCGTSEAGVIEIGGKVVGKSNTYSLAKNDKGLVFTVGNGGGEDPVAAADNWADIKEQGPNGKVGHFGKAVAEATVSNEIGKDDTIDYMEFELETPAKLAFSVTTGNAAKFGVYELVEKKGSNDTVTYSLKSLQGVTLKAGTTTTPALLLEAGTYYLSMEAVDKKAENAAYTITVDPSTYYYENGDNSDDWTNMKAVGNGDGAELDNIGILTEESENPIVEDWVGFSDAVDYKAFTLESAASVVLDLEATDATKLDIWSLSGSAGKYSTKSLANVTGKLDKDTGKYTGSTKAVLLEAGTYYIGVQSTNAAKGGDATYTVSLNEDTAFFTHGDNSDDWTDMKANGAESEQYGNLEVLTPETEGAIINDWVGFGDTVDYKAFTLESAASVIFDLEADDAAKLDIWSLSGSAGKYSLKFLANVTGKLDKETGKYAGSNKAVLLKAGTYYIGVQSTNAAKGGNAGYTVSLNEKSAFFTEGNNDDDWTDMKANGAESDEYGNVGALTAETEGAIVEDWVGFGDAVDYNAFTLNGAAKIAFDVTSTDASKFTVWSLGGSAGKYSLKSLGNVAPKLDKNKGEYIGSTKEMLLDAGTYYFSMESTNAAKGGNAGYTVTVNKKSAFFTEDTKEDNWEDLKKNGAQGKVMDAGELNAETEGAIVEDWVGFGDAVDYRAFEIESGASLVFDVTATDATKFTVWSLAGTEGKYSLKSLGNVALKLDKNTGDYTGSTKALLLEKGTYYLSMESTNAKKGGDATATQSGLAARASSSRKAATMTTIGRMRLKSALKTPWEAGLASVMQSTIAQ